jgi:hypothetical protein
MQILKLITMNDEQNESGKGLETNHASGNESSATGGITDSNNRVDQLNDDYYAVDHAKKDVLSTIGDGEMRDEGLVGAVETTTGIQSYSDQMSDELDLAESQDSEQ